MRETHPLWLRAAVAVGFAVLCAAFPAAKGAVLPEGFIEERVGSGWAEPAGIAFGKNADGSKDRAYVWEREGRVWIVENGEKLAEPLLDISQEVGGFRDMGMLGFALDPNFQANGFLYVLYVVDRHHLMHFGTAQYDPGENEYFEATIGRLTRYTARSSDGYRTTDPASRKVLLGESKSTGFPILYHTHGTGALVFGVDGSLLVSCGDAASSVTVDKGGAAGGNYAKQALADGIITSKENIGAFRCQSLDSLNGKILRLDPATGNGLPGNPFYQSSAPRSARSRVYAYGLRNPYRFALKPGTGNHDRSAGEPGILLAGDVGWSSAEELNIVTRGGLNFGWPLYEGFDRQPSYWPARLAGYDASNHAPPIAAWRNDAAVMAPGSAQPVTLGSAGAEMLGPAFGGYSSTGGVWYEGRDFPEEWRHAYFHADYGGQWIRAFELDDNYRVKRQRPFLAGAPVIYVATHPEKGGLYYISWGGGVNKISYAPQGNHPPKAVAHVSKQSGASPLHVAFSSLGSEDPDGPALSYHWDFGDGTTSTEANPYKTYTASGPQRFQARLTVRDARGAAATADVIVTVNNTAPQATITSPGPQAAFPISGPEHSIPLAAEVSDPDHPADALSYCWNVFLIHNTHKHSEPPQTTKTAVLVASPLPPTATDFYYYRAVLTVTDPLGASATAERIIFPQPGANVHGPYAVLGAPSPVMGSQPLGGSSGSHAAGQPGGGGTQPILIPVLFSKPVTGLEVADFMVSNGSASALSGSGAAWTLTVIPSEPGPVKISLPPGACTDSAGAPNVIGLPVSTFYLPTPDWIPPEAALATPVSAEGPFQVKIDFSEPVTGLTVDDFRIFNGSVTGLAGSGAAYSMTVTPLATGSVFISLPEGSAADAAGNANKASNQIDLKAVMKPAAIPPQMTAPPPQFARRGDAIRLPVFAESGHGGTLVFSANGLPPGLAIDDQSGVISGTVQQGAEASYQSTVTVTDGSLSSSAALSWSIVASSSSEETNGVKGEYFAGEHFNTLVLTRTDKEIHFYWPETTAPGAGLPGDYYSVRWTSKIKVPATGDWKFYADADDGIRLWVDGRLLIDHWNPEPSTSFDLTGPSVQLEAGKSYDLKVELQDFYSDGYVNLKWEGPGFGRQDIPASAYFLPSTGNAPPVIVNPGEQSSVVGEVIRLPVTFSDADGHAVTVTAADLPKGLAYDPVNHVIAGSVSQAETKLVKIAAGDGIGQSLVIFRWNVTPRPSGLNAEYFNGLWFEKSVLKRMDAGVNFYWGGSAPAEGVNKDAFSVVWNGFAVPRQEGEHVFRLAADDNARLWVDDRLIYDGWNAAATGQGESLPVLLRGQKAVPLRVEYRDVSGAARCELYWKTAASPYEIMPSSRLLPHLNGRGWYAISAEEDAAAARRPAFSAAVLADFPRLEHSMRIAVQPDGGKDLSFTRQPDLGEGAVLEVSSDLIRWSGVSAGWSVAAQPDGTEAVTVAGMEKWLGAESAGRLFVRFRLRE